jgi:rfaE bifunctional protein kinase chain/domain
LAFLYLEPFGATWDTAPPPRGEEVPAKVLQAMARIEDCHAVLTGDLILDTYVYGETVRVSREAPVLVVRHERTEHRLGGAANAAANLAALGVSTRVIGVVGEDESGERLRDMLGTAGVAVESVRRAPMTTPQKTRILAGAAGTSRQQVLRLDNEPDTAPPASVADHIASELCDSGRHADVVVVSDYGLGIVSQAVANSARRLAGSGTVVCADSRYGLALLSGVTAITPNVPEAAQLVGFALPDQAAVDRAGQQLLERLACRAVLITQGRAGMTLFCAGQTPYHVGIVGDEEVSDVTGAGDTVTATFAAALGSGLGLRNAMILANCAAGVAVTRAGTTTVLPAEIVSTAERHRVEIEAWDG